MKPLALFNLTGLAKISTGLLPALVLIVANPSPAFAGSDLLMKTSIQISSTQSEEVLNRTIANLKGVFERYQPAVDSGSKIVRPLRVSGSAARPVLQMSIEKCVFIVCETVDLDAEIVLKESGGGCKRNFQLIGDLSKSSDRLRETYDQLNVAICFKPDSSGSGKLDLVASAHQASGYEAGMIQEQIFGMLRLQINPMTKALNEALKANSSGL